jgi:Xaa-Pro aminopeptidase
VCLVLCALPLVPKTGIGLDEYRQRRADLRQALGDAVFILFGGSEGERGDLRSSFFQESNFYYLTGWNEPGAALVMTPEQDVLLIPQRNPAVEKWTGTKAAPGDADIQELTGFKVVLPVESFEQHLPEWVAKAPKVMTLASHARTDAIRRMLPLREIQDASQQLSTLRMKKSEAEIESSRFATPPRLPSRLTKPGGAVPAPASSSIRWPRR